MQPGEERTAPAVDDGDLEAGPPGPGAVAGGVLDEGNELAGDPDTASRSPVDLDVVEDESERLVARAAMSHQMATAGSSPVSVPGTILSNDR